MRTKAELSRITIDIPKDDHVKLKAMAAIFGTSMREIIIELIEEHLFSDRTPNKKTLQAIESVEKGENLESAKDLPDLFKKLGI